MTPRITPGLAGAPTDVDVVVIGLGITGAGVALDAVTRGLSVLAVDAHDLAFGTSRWSSKLVHGGLRYLASGQFGVAHESAVERGILMEVTAPHLTHAMADADPARARVTSRRRPALIRGGLLGGDVLRRGARTCSDTLPRPAASPRPRRSSSPRRCAGPGCAARCVAWDGQLEDDARLVTNVARTAAAYGAHVRTRARVLSATGTSVELRDELTGDDAAPSPPATVVNATGVWAGDLVDEITLRPSRGTHLVLRAESASRACAPRSSRRSRATTNRFVLVLPQPDGTVYIGLTDEPVEGEIPDVPEPSEPEIGFLLDVVSRGLRAAAAPQRRGRRVRRAAAAARPPATGETADLSRRHAVLTSRTGVVTIVGGKLTTYRRMAEDAVDAAVAHAGLDRRRLPHPRRCRCSAPPTAHRWPGSSSRPGWSAASAPTPRLVLDNARAVTGLGDDELLAPIAEGVPVTLAELVFGVTHEGAADVDDLLDRRTRVGLVPADRALAVPARRARAGASLGDEFAVDAGR